MTDPISNFIAQIKNGYLASKKQIKTPASKMKESLAHVLSKQGYLGKVSIDSKDKVKKILIAELVYEEKTRKLTDIRRVSKPGRRVYVAKKAIGKVLGGLGIKIISTPKGLMTDRDARKNNLGGEVICELW
jgi:small subunit ribosomal protein S8